MTVKELKSLLIDLPMVFDDLEVCIPVDNLADDSVTFQSVSIEKSGKCQVEVKAHAPDSIKAANGIVFLIVPNTFEFQ